MKKPTDFTRLMTSYLSSYLPLQRNVSQNTITSYCDTFRLLLTFLRDEKAMNIATAVICTIILRIQHMSFGVIVCQPCK